MMRLGGHCVYFSVSSVLLIYSLFLVQVRTAGLGVAEVSLNGVWDLRNSNGSLSLSAEVPGCVHTALQQHKII